MAISSRNTLLAALAFIAFQAQAVNVTVAYQTSAEPAKVAQADNTFAKEGANKRGNTSRLTQSFHFFMFEPIFSPVNALNQPI